MGVQERSAAPDIAAQAAPETTRSLKAVCSTTLGKRLEVEVTILNWSKHFESKRCSTAWSTTARNEMKIPTGAARNTPVLQLTRSSPFPSLCISIWLHVSKHKGSPNPNPTTFIHMSDKPLHTMALPKPTITLTLIARVWNEVKDCCSGLCKEQCWQPARIEHRNTDVLLLLDPAERDNGEQL